jgi:hypothetical protein
VPKADLAAGWEKKEGFLFEDEDEDEDDETSDPELETIRDLTGRVADATPETWGALADTRFDRAAFVDWQLLAMVGFTEDSVGKNAYVHVDPETGVATLMPWDFNASWGQSWKTYRRDPAQLRDHAEHNRIFWMHENDPESLAALQARYTALRDGGPFDPAWQKARLDEYFAEIDRAAQKDWDMWGADYMDFERWRQKREDKQDWTDFEGEKACLYAWIDARAAEVPRWVFPE